MKSESAAIGRTAGLDRQPGLPGWLPLLVLVACRLAWDLLVLHGAFRSPPKRLLEITPAEFFLQLLESSGVSLIIWD